MNVYAIEVFVNNHEEYEDYDSDRCIYKVFANRNDAVSYINNEENLKNIALKCVGNVRAFILEKDQPIQLSMQNYSTVDRKIFEAWPYDEIFSEDGNEIIGYKSCENPCHWNMAWYEVSIVEWEVE